MNFIASQYYNDTERNIHIFSSALSQDRVIALIGGVFTQGNLKYKDIYDMLRIIINMNIHEMRLVQIQDWRYSPRINQQLEPHQFQSMTSQVYQHLPPNPPATNYIPIGDYILFIFNRPGSCYPEVPDLKTTPIQGRTTRASVTATNQSARSTNVRTAVRSRDGGCRISGFPCLNRRRGPNYKGFQVAHIFPLAYVNKDVAWKVSNRQAADVVTNAILLRSDIHDQFDDYQISCRSDNQLVRFERNGAPNVVLSPNPLAPTYITRPASVASTTRDFDSDLMQHHYRTAVLWHVAGYGRRLGQ
ncbi:hypothetical protein F5878DRAFT_613609 [Lentinula raphanica]|uniref:HNH nuclease domain-containing protein n=1 Tax=Lentinula raphanica TaxID=153919 RepID=A0AA38UFV7_9AGAR|nr:hypothetical protein F5878DRAFT_613609 [Lentinula raphanica]